jgi:hypothetical protein
LIRGISLPWRMRSAQFVDGLAHMVTLTMEWRWTIRSDFQPPCS